MSKRKKQELSYIEHYEIVSELGEGGNAKVYQAKCKSNDGLVALKVLQNFENEILNDNIFNINPYSERMKNNLCLGTSNNNLDLPNVDNYIKSNYQTWSFLEDLNIVEQSGKNSKLAFYMEFKGIEKFSGLLSAIFWYLAKDGTIKKANKGDVSDCFVLKEKVQLSCKKHLMSTLNRFAKDTMWSICL